MYRSVPMCRLQATKKIYCGLQLFGLTIYLIALLCTTRNLLPIQLLRKSCERAILWRNPPFMLGSKTLSLLWKLRVDPHKCRLLPNLWCLLYCSLNADTCCLCTSKNKTRAMDGTCLRPLVLCMLIAFSQQKKESRQR